MIVDGDLHVGPKYTSVYTGPERLQLQTLLARVKNAWVTKVLQEIICQVPLIDLRMHIDPEAINRPQERGSKIPNNSPLLLDPDKKIIDIFDDNSGLLLLLGEAGSGKTIALLRLAADLISRFEHDEGFVQPVPAYFNLSTWTKNEALIDWLVAELSDQYSIAKTIGQVWFKENRLVLLLDGLDEVRVEHRAACVEAINEFSKEIGLAGLVVCSRVNEYFELPVRLNLYEAIRLEVLSLEQIDDYLVKAGSKLATLRDILQNDKQLQRLAQNPLMLGIMSLAYQNLTIHNLTSEELTISERREHLFNTYIEQMFNHQGNGERSFSKEQTKLWLSWSALQMNKHYQSSFLIERIQPSWLSLPVWRWAYICCSRLSAGLIGGLIGGLIIGSVWGIDGMSIGILIDGAVEGLTGGLVGGIAVSFIEIFKFEKRSNSEAAEQTLTRRQLVTNTILILAVSWSAVALVFSLVFGLISWHGLGYYDWLQEGILVGLLVGLSFSTLFGAGAIFGARENRQGFSYDIQTVEYLNWSRDGAVRGGGYGLILGLVAGLIVGVIDALPTVSTPLSISIRNAGLPVILAAPLIAVLFFGLFGVIQGGLRGIIVKPEEIDYPNQGIWLTLRNARNIGFQFGLGFSLLGLFVGAIIGYLADQTILIIIYIMYGLFFGVIAAIWYGGLEVIKHFTLRLMLYFEKDTPRPDKYVEFLDYATNLIFLRKTGRGYIFIHRLLRNHFADLNKVSKEIE